MASDTSRKGGSDSSNASWDDRGRPMANIEARSDAGQVPSTRSSSRPAASSGKSGTASGHQTVRGSFDGSDEQASGFEDDENSAVIRLALTDSIERLQFQLNLLAEADQRNDAEIEDRLTRLEVEVALLRKHYAAKAGS